MSETILRVHHACLTRVVYDSAYKSRCPTCYVGTLPMTRDESARLQRDDYCLNCGQLVEYQEDEVNRERLWPWFTTRLSR